jgi:hypothetical protein
MVERVVLLISVFIFLVGCGREVIQDNKRFCSELELNRIVRELAPGWSAEEMRDYIYQKGCNNPTRIVFENNVKKLYVLTENGWKWVTYLGLQ